MYRNILVHVEPGPGEESVLRCALLLARRFSGHMEGVHMVPGRPEIVAAGADGFVAASPDLVAGFEREARERAMRAETEFRAFCEAHGVPFDDGAAEGPSGSFRIEEGAGPGALAAIARAFDVTVQGRPRQDSPVPAMSALEALLFESGRPVLVAPPEPPAGEVLGETVVIAWNGGTETARTIAFAMPLILAAKRVVVLTVSGAFVPGPSGAELVARLRRHRPDVELVERESEGRAAAGAAILQAVHELGGDLLLKGAYTTSRLRQLIFGGATSFLLVNADVPMIMAN